VEGRPSLLGARAPSDDVIPNDRYVLQQVDFQPCDVNVSYKVLALHAVEPGSSMPVRKYYSARH
jgi:hypothetical protein